MPKVWVLDTGTKGTGASIVPLDQQESSPAAAPEPLYVPPKPRPKPAPAPAPRAPRRFKVVDVVSGRTLAEDVDTRATLGVLAAVRSVIDVRVWIWNPKTDDWRLSTLSEQRALWDARPAAS
jgi:hypothetical protein